MGAASPHTLDDNDDDCLKVLNEFEMEALEVSDRDMCAFIV